MIKSPSVCPCFDFVNGKFCICTPTDIVVGPGGGKSFEKSQNPDQNCPCNPCNCEHPGKDQSTLNLNYSKPTHQNVSPFPCYPCIGELPKVQKMSKNDGNCPCSPNPCPCQPPARITSMEFDTNDTNLEKMTINGMNCLCYPNPCNCESTDDDGQNTSKNDAKKDKCPCTTDTDPCDCPEVKDEVKDEVKEADLKIDFDFEGYLSANFKPNEARDKVIQESIRIQLQDLKDDCWEKFQGSNHQSQDLTKQDIVDSIVQNPDGTSEVQMPGNVLVPKFLPRRIGDMDMDLFLVLNDYPEISSLNLAYNEIGDDGIVTLGDIIKDHPNIRNVNLMYNNLSGVGILGLVKCLIECNRPLESLRLTGNKIGSEGLDALACLILSGRCPKDLDIGDCDLTGLCEGFEVLLAALWALDHDIDSPEFLEKRSLPIGLDELKDRKIKLNDEIEAKGKSESRGFQLEPDTEFPYTDHNLKSGGLPAFEHFSSAILEGLFDLREKLGTLGSSDVQNNTTTNNSTAKNDSNSSNYQQEKISKLSEINRLYEQVVENNRGGDGEEILTLNPEGLPEILTRSLYTLESTKGSSSSGSIASDLTKNDDDDEITQQLCPAVDEILLDGCDGASAFNRRSKKNVNCCAFANDFVKDLILQAGNRAGSSELGPLTDITQLLLMEIYELVRLQNVKNWANDKDQHVCYTVFEKSVQNILPLFKSILFENPENCSKINQELLREFVWQLFVSFHGAYKPLLENPELFANELTSECFRKKIEIKAGSSLAGIMDSINFQLENDAQLGGNTDQSNQNCESDLNSIVKKLIETGGKMAAIAKMKGEEIRKAESEIKSSAQKFLDEIFEMAFEACTWMGNQTNSAMSERLQSYMKPVQTQEKQNQNFMDTASYEKSIYPFISRPTRLVLSRPLFGPYADKMAQKFGEYLKENKSLKHIYLQKWIFGESGLNGLLTHGLMNNSNIVTLDLSGNGIGPDVQKLGKYLTINKSLKDLNLSHNRLHDTGLNHLIPNLAQSSLESLNLAHNYLSESLNRLLPVIPETSIRALYLWGNLFEPIAWKLMKELMEKGVIEQKFTDIILQKSEFGGEKSIVQNQDSGSSSFIS